MEKHTSVHTPDLCDSPMLVQYNELKHNDTRMIVPQSFVTTNNKITKNTIIYLIVSILKINKPVLDVTKTI